MLVSVACYSRESRVESSRISLFCTCYLNSMMLNDKHQTPWKMKTNRYFVSIDTQWLFDIDERCENAKTIKIFSFIIYTFRVKLTVQFLGRTDAIEHRISNRTLYEWTSMDWMAWVSDVWCISLLNSFIYYIILNTFWHGNSITKHKGFLLCCSNTS